MKFLLLVIFFTLASPILSQTRPCGPARPCSAGYCCTRIPPLQDTCFSEPEHCCTTRCLSNCWDGPKCWAACSNQSLMVDVNGIHSIVTPELFSEMMPTVDEACQASGFYTYDAFIAAASSFNGFGTSGDVTARKREVAAFLAQAAHEITAAATKEQLDKPLKWTCSTATDPIISFNTAIRLWMTPQLWNPSSHDVIIGRWTPSDTDRAANRLPRSFGVVTNIINGGAECGNGWDARVANRIAFYLRNCEILQVAAGQNLDCYHQKPFAAATSDMMIKMKLDESAA